MRAKKGDISVRKIKNGFEARTTINIYSVGSMRISRFSAKSESEAIKKVQDAIVEVYMKFDADITGNYAKSINMKKLNENSDKLARKKYEDKQKEKTKIKNVAIEWLTEKQKEVDPEKPRHISPKTLQGYVCEIKSRIIPAFGEISIADLTIKELQNYFDKRTDSPKSMRDTLLALKLLFDFAKKQKYVTSNIATEIILPPLRKPKISYLTKDRQEIWLNTFEKDGRSFALLFSLMLQTGVRPEEACGLKWKNINFNENYITIDNAYKQKIIYDKNFNKIGIEREDGELKTQESYRDIPMTSRLKKMLIKLYYENKSYFKSKNKTLTGYDYVFLNEADNPYTSEDLTHKMTYFRKAHNLEHCTVYGLRHSFASLCSEKEVSDVVLKELMGHADPTTTKKYYIHISLDRKKNEFSRIWN